MEAKKSLFALLCPEDLLCKQRGLLFAPLFSCWECTRPTFSPLLSSLACAQEGIWLAFQYLCYESSFFFLSNVSSFVARA